MQKDQKFVCFNLAAFGGVVLRKNNRLHIQGGKIPKKFIRAERAIERSIKAGRIPKFYWKGGRKYKSNPYALARKSTGYYGTTFDIGLKKRK